MVFGIVKRQTYTNITDSENYLWQLQVAELSEELTERACAVMERELPVAPLILRVEVTGEIENTGREIRQRAVVRQIYAGSGPAEGEEIYIFSDHWHLSFSGGISTVERGFVNIMEVGGEYLVFAEDVAEIWGIELPSVKVYDDFLIAPVFSYEEHPCVIMPVSGGSTYVDYRDVKDNEFFMVSEAGLQAMKELKDRLLQMYPAGD